MRRSHSAIGVLSAALILTACEGERPRGPGGGTVQPGQTFNGLYVANPDHGTVTRLSVKSGAWSKVQVGKEPTRIARFEGRVYVTNRAERLVTILEDDGQRLQAVGTLRTGAEPVGIAANGSRIYVAASVQNQILEYDAETLEALRVWNVEGEPRGLALHDSGASLIAAQTFGGKYAHIDLDSGEVTMMEMPVMLGFDFETGTEHELSRRITGDPVYSADGGRLAIPVLYADNTSPIFDPNDEPDPNGDANGDARRPPGGEGYQNRMNPGVVVAPVDGAGRPIAENAMAISVNSFVIEEDNGSQVGRQVNAFPSSVTFTPDGDFILAALTGADAVVAVDLTDSGISARPTDGAGAEAPGIAIPGMPGLMFLPNVAVRTGGGPVGIAVIGDDRAYVHAQFDNTVETIDLEQVKSFLRPGTVDGNGFRAPPGDPATGVPQQLASFDARIIESNILPANVDRGRRLFFSSSNRAMAADGAGVSCSTCHFDSRTDGLTWNFTRGPRQTPSLAGNVSLSEPVGWQGDRPTVAEDAMMTSQGLMGGDGLTDQDAQDIQAFVNFTRDVDNPHKDGDAAAIQRGKEIFSRSSVGCANCHYGPTYTNNQVVPMFELERAKVRPLNGIAMTAPYFHDGSAATLYDVLVMVRDGSMGNTSELSEEELRDLETYLKSL